MSLQHCCAVNFLFSFDFVCHYYVCCSYSSPRGLLKYQHKLYVCPYQMPLITFLHWKWLQTFFFLSIWLFLSGWCSFSVLFAFSFFTVLPCGMEFKQHCTGLSKHRELQQGTTCSAFRQGDRLQTKLMLLSHCEKVPNIFILETGLLKTNVIHRILRRNVNWCVKYSSFQCQSRISPTLEVNYFVVLETENFI